MWLNFQLCCCSCSWLWPQNPFQMPLFSILLGKQEMSLFFLSFFFFRAIPLSLLELPFSSLVSSCLFACSSYKNGRKWNGILKWFIWNNCGLALKDANELPLNTGNAVCYRQFPKYFPSSWCHFSVSWSWWLNLYYVVLIGWENVAVTGLWPSVGVNVTATEVQDTSGKMGVQYLQLDLEKQWTLP